MESGSPSNRNRLTQRLTFLLVAPSLLLLAVVLTQWVVPFLEQDLPETYAVSRTWDGGGDGESWNDPLNWNPDGIPVTADDITIDSNVTVQLPSVSNDFLVHYWPMNDNAATTNVIDGYGSNDGTADQNTSNMSVSGQVGNALDFDGSNDHIDYGDLNTTSLDEISVAAWVNFDDLTGHQAIYTDGGNVRGFEFGLYNDELHIGIENNNSNRNLGYATSNLSTGTWYHVVAVADGPSGNLFLYVNGSLVAFDTGLTAFTDFNGTNGTTIGTVHTQSPSSNEGGLTSPAYTFDGTIDDVRVFQYPITGGDIASLYNGGSGSSHKQITPSSSINSLTLGNGSGTTTPTLNFNYDSAGATGEFEIDSASGTPLVVNSNATITHTAQDDDIRRYSVWIDLDGTASATIDGSINLEGKGYTPGFGPTTSGSVVDGVGGGGGNGGTGGGEGGGTTTGSGVGCPTSPGGAGASDVGVGGSGGGVLLIEVPGTMTVNGTIDLDASATTSLGNPGGGAGGSMCHFGGTVNGTGTITANGSDGYNGGGGGGGGRIKLECTVSCDDTIENTTDMTATGGDDDDTGVQRWGGAGTVYDIEPGAGNNDMRILNPGFVDVDFDDRETGVTRIGATATIENLTITDEGNLELVSGQTYTVTNFTWGGSGTESYITDNGGVLAQVTAGPTFTVPSDAMFYGNTTRSYNGGTINGVLTHSNNTTSQTNTLDHSYINLTINSGGSIDVSERGYEGAAGPGAGSLVDGAGGGGGYGGDGGDGGNTSGGIGGIGTSGGDANGATTLVAELLVPDTLGSGGANDIGNDGGRGGGLIDLTVTDGFNGGTLTITGEIKADGGTPVDFSDHGGGSGGGIYITADIVDGTGTISAVGGDGVNNGAGGGGGRIAIYFDAPVSSDFPLTDNVSFEGGTSENQSNRFGGSGTYFRKADSWGGGAQNGRLEIDNADQFETGDDTRIGRTPIDATLALRSLFVENGGNLELQSGSTLTYTNNFEWDNEGRFTDNGGTFINNITSGGITVPATSKLFANTDRIYTQLTVNGTLTHSNNTDTHVNDMDLTVSGSVTVNSGGAINVDERGYYSAQGPGAGTIDSNVGGGGGYGGDGGDAGPINGDISGIGTTGGDAYGGTNIVTEIKDPDSLGSGGMNDLGPGGRGGGSINISAGINFNLNTADAISADGGSGSTNDQGGGSGGSIFLDAGSSINGASGTITATGGTGNLNAGGGGGGRVSLEFTDSGSFDLVDGVLVEGGPSGNQGTDRMGGSGTYYRYDTNWGGDDGILVIDNADQFVGNNDLRIGRTPIDGTISLRSLTIRDGGNLDFQSGAVITYSNNFNWDDQGQVTDSNGTTLSPITGGGALTVAQNSTLFANTTRTYTTLTVDGLITHSNNADLPTHRVILNLTTLDVNATGSINVDDRGHESEQGLGAGTNSGNQGGGAGHGGTGGDCFDTGCAGGIIGSPTVVAAIRTPVSIGSGGAADNGAGGQGGGGINLSISGNATIDGILSADGETVTSQDQGGGAGGSILLDVGGAISGTWSASADGGNANGNGGGGGGGRISVKYLSIATTPTLTAYGGTSENVDNRFGGAGTIYYEDTDDDTNGHIIIDNNNQDSLIDLRYGKTLIENGVSQTLTVDTLTIRNKGHYDNSSLSTLNYSGLTVASAVVTDNGGTLAFVSGGGALNIGSNGKMYANTARTYSSITIDGVLSHSKNTTAETHEIHLTTTGAFSVGATGSVDVTGMGYTSGSGPGAGVDAGNWGSGAGHGGDGGDTDDGGSTGGSAYGSATDPQNIGSGGGPDGAATGESGGGMIEIDADSMSIAGNIVADAGTDGTGNDRGGGAGGSINLSATNAVTGVGLLSANGSSGQDSRSGAGAGGRIRVDCASNSMSTDPTVDPGSVGNTADSGTISYGAGCTPTSPPTVDSVQVGTTANGANVTPLTLTANTTTTYYVNGQVSDPDGFGDITDVDARLYRSGATGGVACTADNNDCYIQTTCSLTGGSGNSIDYSCQIDLQYYTDPTVTGSTYPTDTWNARVTVTDGVTVVNDDSYTNEVEELTAISYASSIDHGTLALGATSASNQLLNILNAGNMEAQANVSMASAMSCATGSIPIGNNKWGLSDVAYASLSNTLTSTPTSMGLTLPAQTNDASQPSDATYWGIQIPGTGVKGLCTGTVTITGYQP